MGRRREDASLARIRVEAVDQELLEEILTRIQEHGAELVNSGDVRLEPAPLDGVFPEQFHVTSNHPMEVRLNGRWHPVTPTRMDCGITVDPASGEARAATVEVYLLRVEERLKKWPERSERRLSWVSGARCSSQRPLLPMTAISWCIEIWLALTF